MKSLINKMLMITGLLVGCDDYLDINDDPNNPVEVQANLILPTTQVQTAFVLAKDLNLQTAAIMQYYAGVNNQLLSYDTYFFNGTEADNIWLNIFAGVLLDLNNIIEISEPRGDNLMIGIAQTQMAYIYGIATDLYGDIPFSQALKDIEIVAPEFDTQESIYAGIQTLLDNALVNLSNPDPGFVPASTDLIYGGDADQWIQLANSLKVKYWVQVRLRKPAEAATAINALVSAGNLMDSNEDNFSLTFGTDNGNQHPMYDFAFNRRPGDIAISQRFIDSLNVLNDPRIDEYLNDNGQGTYLGFDNGGTGAPPGQTVRALLGEFAVGNNGDAPQRLLTYYGLQFYLAEAALTLNTVGPARDYYEEGMTAAMSEAGVSASDAQTYINARLAEYDAAATNEERLKIVIRDKWVANFGNAVEAFNDWRRTGYPDLQPSSTPLTPDGSIPVRLLYSSNELSSNPNLEEQSQLIDPVWWDVQ